jgi:hypothetical protein
MNLEGQIKKLVEQRAQYFRWYQEADQKLNGIKAAINDTSTNTGTGQTTGRRTVAKVTRGLKTQMALAALGRSTTPIDGKQLAALVPELASPAAAGMLLWTLSKSGRAINVGRGQYVATHKPNGSAVELGH